ILWLAAPTRDLRSLRRACGARGVPDERLPLRGHLDPGLLPGLRRWLQRAAPDILHLHLIHAQLHGTLAARGCGLALVATRHGTERYQRWPPMRLLARRLDAAAARVIAPSSWVAEYARRWDGTPRAKLRVIPHGIDLRRYAAAPPPMRRAGCVFTALARLHASKEHAVLLDAFARAAPHLPAAELWLAGEGPLRGALERRVGRLPADLRARIRFLGEVTDVPPLLAASDVVVLPGPREGFGLAALEAMAIGRPVIGPRGGALPELIEAGGSGLLYAPGERRALAAALLRLGRDPERRRAWGAHGRRIAAGYGRARMVDATLRLYHEILAA
ncbi:MAG: glycosyltransferase, partial [Candidatus Eisenbacteria bacterium]|nr:glycosyltransferase [Candidatus Eisenbacteria bacterium]